VIGHVPVPPTLTPQQELPVPVDWAAATFRGSVWTIWSAGQCFAAAGNRTITPRFSMPQHCRYADYAAT
jgi:hypothetical protein